MIGVNKLPQLNNHALGICIARSHPRKEGGRKGGTEGEEERSGCSHSS